MYKYDSENSHVTQRTRDVALVPSSYNIRYRSLVPKDGKVLWCDARTSSSEWYKNRGPIPFGDILQRACGVCSNVYRCRGFGTCTRRQLTCTGLSGVCPSRFTCGTKFTNFFLTLICLRICLSPWRLHRLGRYAFDALRS